jgi:hypothetical protein
MGITLAKKAGFCPQRRVFHKMGWNFFDGDIVHYTSLAESYWIVLSGCFWDWCASGKSKHTGFMLWLEVPVYCRSTLLLECTSKTVAHDTVKIRGEGMLHEKGISLRY